MPTGNSASSIATASQGVCVEEGGNSHKRKESKSLKKMPPFNAEHSGAPASAGNARRERWPSTLLPPDLAVVTFGAGF